MNPTAVLPLAELRPPGTMQLKELAPHCILAIFVILCRRRMILSAFFWGYVLMELLWLYKGPHYDGKNYVLLSATIPRRRKQ
jgi:hypothetical protein